LTKQDTLVDLVPFLFVADVDRSISFYEALGFSVIKRHEPQGRLEFAGMEATSSAKIMLARTVAAPNPGADPYSPSPGFLYLYTHDLDRFRERLIRRGIEPGEIEEGPGPGPERQLCLADPDGNRHMVAEIGDRTVGRGPRLVRPDDRPTTAEGLGEPLT
jgi:catechol 2,3-dioxygenase-like lactoylglutathione lyase family enzyme